MSDTDDTDVLLLIPPDFFLINSDTESSLDGNWNEHCRLHCDLVENLAGELGNLKSRVSCIENISISSSLCSMDRLTETGMSSRNYQFMDRFQNQSYLPISTNSTPQKPRTKLVANSLPSTPSTDRDLHRKQRKKENYESKVESKAYAASKSHSQQSMHGFFENDADVSSVASSPDKRENKEVLGEIDQFLSHVKTIKRFVAQKKLEKEFHPAEKEPHSLPISFDSSPLKLSDLQGEGDTKVEKRKGLDLKDVDKLLQTMEEQQQKMEKLAPVNRIVEGNETQIHTWKPGENKNSVPDFNYGVRDIMYAKDDNQKLNSVQNYLNHCNPAFSNVDLELLDSDTTTNDITPPTVLENTAENYMLKKPQNELTRNPLDFIPDKNVNVFDFVTQTVPPNKTVKSKPAGDFIKKAVQSNVEAVPNRNVKNFSNEVTFPNYNLQDLWKNTHKTNSCSQNPEVNIMSRLEDERTKRQVISNKLRIIQIFYFNCKNILLSKWDKIGQCQ